MFVRKSALVSFLAFAAFSVSDGFTVVNPSVASRNGAMQQAAVTELYSTLSEAALSESDIRKELNYKPGEASTDLARRYKHLVGEDVKTVGEAFSEFTQELGYTVNPLYKNMVTDIVGTTHLIVVCARFKRDPVWSLGIVSALEMLLKNYPEQDVSKKIISSLFKSVGLDEAEIRAEAEQMASWAASATREEIETAISGEGDSVLARTASAISGDEYWMYSRYFGIGLVKIMEIVGIEMDKDEVYPIMEEWMTNKLGRSHLSACSDSDLFFKVKEKLDMMETMMKEIEIREKKRMAERLEAKAEAALRMADTEAKMKEEIEAEAAKNRERVDA